MPTNIKVNQIINETVNAEWFFLTKRPDIPPLPIWYKMKFSALSEKNKKIYTTNIPWACFFYDNNIEVYLHGKEYRLTIQKATKILYSKQKFNEHLVKLKQSCHDVKKAAMIFDKPHWKNFNNEQLFNLYISMLVTSDNVIVDVQ